jgi:hypothetical protein
VSASTPKNAATIPTLTRAALRGGSSLLTTWAPTANATVTAHPCQEMGLQPQPQRFGPNQAVRVNRVTVR